MSWLRQFVALLRMAVAGLLDRRGNAFIVSFGVACAVGVLTAVLSIGEGIDTMVMKNVSADRVVLRGSTGSAAIEIPQNELPVIQALPGIRRSMDGAALLSPDVLVTVQARRRSDHARGSLTIMGVGERFAEVYPEISIIEGRLFRSGMHEVIVGVSAQQSFRNLAVGDFLDYDGARWNIVGTFDAAGGLAQTRLIGDATTVAAVFKRSGVDYVTVVRERSMSLPDLKRSIDTSSQMQIEVQTEADVRKAESRQLTGMVTFIGYFIGSIMALGAGMGALNSMYMMVDTRRRDHATLRALGFSSSAIAVAVLTEALVLAIPGALIGLSVPWMLFNDSAVSFVGLSFALAVTPQLAAIGALCALTIGLVGGSLPALRAARAPIAVALRAS